MAPALGFGLFVVALGLVTFAVIGGPRTKRVAVAASASEPREGASVSASLIAALIGAVVLGLLAAVALGGGSAFALPVVLVVVVAIGSRVFIARRSAKRKAAFAEQLDDTLQLIASGLRAGHSLARAVEAVSQDAASPTSEEFARIANENRLGRDLGEAMRDTAERMGSDDLVWAAQAVDIHREVGGNLSEVLDHVSETIRERNQVRRDIQTLSAEGRMSANVLFALPVVVGLALSVISPGYLTLMFTTVPGFVLLAVSAVLFVVAVLWIRAVVKVDF